MPLGSALLRRPVTIQHTIFQTNYRPRALSSNYTFILPSLCSTSGARMGGYTPAGALEPRAELRSSARGVVTLVRQAPVVPQSVLEPSTDSSQNKNENNGRILTDLVIGGKLSSTPGQTSPAPVASLVDPVSKLPLGCMERPRYEHIIRTCLRLERYVRAIDLVFEFTWDLEVRLNRLLWNKVMQHVQVCDPDAIAILCGRWMTKLEGAEKAQMRTKLYRLIQQVVNRMNVNDVESVMRGNRGVDMHPRLREQMVRRLFLEHDTDKAVKLLEHLATLSSTSSSSVVPLSTFTCNILISRLTRLSDLARVEQTLISMLRLNIPFDAYTFNTIINAHLPNSLTLANATFSEMKRQGVSPTTITYNTFIKHFASQGDWSNVIAWHSDMTQTHHLSPTPSTVRIIMHALSRSHSPQSLDRLVSIFHVLITSTDLAIIRAHVYTEHIYNILMSALIRHDRPSQALRLFTAMLPRLRHPPTLTTYNILLHALVRTRDFTSARALYNAMARGTPRHPAPDVITYTTLIAGYLAHKPTSQDLRHALHFYTLMLARGLRPSHHTRTVLILGFARIGDLRGARRAFDEMIAEEDTAAPPVERSIVPYNAMMTVYLFALDVPAALTILKASIARGVRPTRATVNVWARGMAIVKGDIAGAMEIVTMLEREGGVKLDAQAWAYLVEGAVSRGEFEAAKVLVEEVERREVVDEEGKLEKLVVLVRGEESGDGEGIGEKEAEWGKLKELGDEENRYELDLVMELMDDAEKKKKKHD